MYFLTSRTVAASALLASTAHASFYDVNDSAPAHLDAGSRPVGWAARDHAGKGALYLKIDPVITEECLNMEVRMSTFDKEINFRVAKASWLPEEQHLKFVKSKVAFPGVRMIKVQSMANEFRELWFNDTAQRNKWYANYDSALNQTRKYLEDVCFKRITGKRRYVSKYRYTNVDTPAPAVPANVVAINDYPIGWAARHDTDTDTMEPLYLKLDTVITDGGEDMEIQLNTFDKMVSITVARPRYLHTNKLNPYPTKGVKTYKSNLRKIRAHTSEHIYEDLYFENMEQRNKWYQNYWSVFQQAIGDLEFISRRKKQQEDKEIAKQEKNVKDKQEKDDLKRKIIEQLFGENGYIKKREETKNVLKDIETTLQGQQEASTPSIKAENLYLEFKKQNKLDADFKNHMFMTYKEATALIKKQFPNAKTLKGKGDCQGVHVLRDVRTIAEDEVVEIYNKRLVPRTLTWQMSEDDQSNGHFCCRDFANVFMGICKEEQILAKGSPDQFAIGEVWTYGFDSEDGIDTTFPKGFNFSHMLNVVITHDKHDWSNPEKRKVRLFEPQSGTFIDDVEMFKQKLGAGLIFMCF